MEDRLEADLALGLEAELVGELEALVAEHPLREGFWRQLMLALYRSGRRAEALTAFGRAREVLVEELALEPGSLSGADEETGPRLARALGNFWRIHGHLDEGRRWLNRALAAYGHTPTALRADLLGNLGSLYMRQNDFERAQELLEDAIEIATRTGANWSAGHWLHFLAYTWRAQGRYEPAKKLLAESMRIKRAIGDLAGEAYSLGSLADIAQEEGRLEESGRLYDEGFDLLRRTGSPPAQMVAYIESTAKLALLRGDDKEGVRLAEEGLSQARELGDVWHVGLNLTNPRESCARPGGPAEGSPSPSGGDHIPVADQGNGLRSRQP